MVAADYFDGQSARAHHVVLALDGDSLQITGEEINRREVLSKLRISEPMGIAPRLIKFPDGAHCEVRDHAALAVLLANSGYRDRLVVRLQSHWNWALAAVLVMVLTVFAGYRWGLPAASEWIAFKLPDQALAKIGDTTLTILDDNVFKPSKLTVARQQVIQNDFGKLQIPDQIVAQHHIVFRDGGNLGANALALPDGTIVVTDQLVKLALKDAEIHAVLGHELGHLKRRHSLRMLIQSSIVSAVVAWYVGDVSSVAAGLPTFLLQARYSRDHEREADLYAANMLKVNGMQPSLLGDILERMEQAHSKQTETAGHESEQPGWEDYLASHPATRERIEALR